MNAKLEPAFFEAGALIEPQIDARDRHIYSFDESFPVDVRFLMFSRTNNIRLNHHDYFELLYLQSGEVIYQVENRLLRFRPGDLFVIGGGLRHRMAKYARPCAKAAALYFLPSIILDGAGPDDAAYLEPFSSQCAAFPHVVPERTGLPAQVFEFMKRIASELPVSTPRDRLHVKTLLKMILMLLLDHFSVPAKLTPEDCRNKRDRERLRPLFDYVESHLASPIAIGTVARMLHMSRSNFMRLFKRATGESFVSYLNHKRIAKAQELLARTDRSIADIGQEVGFCDQSYFGLVFRQAADTTPREYRRAMRDHFAQGIRPVEVPSGFKRSRLSELRALG